jgi:molybdopterin molybdotransferase
MEIEIQLTNGPIAEKISPSAQLDSAPARGLNFAASCAIWKTAEKFPRSNTRPIPKWPNAKSAGCFTEISARHPCLAAKVIHRVGIIPVGETAIYVGVAGRHRGETIALLAEFMDRLKQDVPIWKRRALPVETRSVERARSARTSSETHNLPNRSSALQIRSLDEAIGEISSRCQPLPPVRVSLKESFGRVLRETVCALEDLPANDRSTRDGYAILIDDPSGSFQIVDAIYAADWKPRQLQRGEAVRVATGAVLPCDGVRVVMQENVERNGDQIKIVKREDALNFRKRGEDVKAGAPLVQFGARLDAGKLALLATAGYVKPIVSPRLRVVHFTTGDEIVPPGQTPKPGQIRDSNSILIRGLLENFDCELVQKHLPENFEAAKLQIENRKSQIENVELVLISGGASVGDKDFTRPLLEWLGFEIIFSQVNLRPGKPLIFGVNGARVAFGLPGNPLAHFVCFHFAAATALARLSGEAAPKFLRGRLGTKLDDAVCPRETLWPARLEWNGGSPQLSPLAWASSGDVTCLALANALMRVPAKVDSLKAGAEFEFLPTAVMLVA